MPQEVALVSLIFFAPMETTLLPVDPGNELDVVGDLPYLFQRLVIEYVALLHRHLDRDEVGAPERLLELLIRFHVWMIAGQQLLEVVGEFQVSRPPAEQDGKDVT